MLTDHPIYSVEKNESSQKTIAYAVMPMLQVDLKFVSRSLWELDKAHSESSQQNMKAR